MSPTLKKYRHVNNIDKGKEVSQTTDFERTCVKLYNCLKSFADCIIVHVVIQDETTTYLLKTVSGSSIIP